MVGTVICGQIKDSCYCVEQTGHERNHACRCGGSWDKDGVPVTFPGGGTFWDLFDPDYREDNFGAFPDPQPVGDRGES